MMDSISPWLVVAPALIILGVSLLAVAGMFVVRGTSMFAHQFSDNDVAGPLFSVMGLVYGALLAFVVFATWETFAGAQVAVTHEAAVLVETYRDTQTFPEPQRTQAQAALRTYATTVISTEWETNTEMMAHNQPDLLNPIWDIVRSIEPAKSIKSSDLVSATDHLHDLELQRHLRHLSGEAALPWEFWPMLLLGGAVVVVFSYFFHQSSLTGQALMTGVFSAMLTSVLLLIFSLNQPFTGPVPVRTDPFMHALEQFTAIDTVAGAASPSPSASSMLMGTSPSP